MKLVVGGVDRTAMLYDAGSSVSYSSDMTSRGVMTLICRDYARSWNPSKGQAVQIYSPDNVTLFWSGSIDDVDQDYKAPYIGYKDLTLKCVDNNQIATRLIAAEAYTNTLAGDIFTDLVTKYLVPEGVTLGTIEPGTMIASFVVNYEHVDAACTRLTNLDGRGWNIDKNLVASFRDRASVAAPFGITDTTKECLSLRISDARDQYRNRQYVMGGSDYTTSRAESFTGDGTRRTFTTQFPVGKVPTVTVNGVSKTIGIGGVETGKDWYWNKGSNEISQDGGGTLLTTSDTLIVTYQGIVPILALVQDDAKAAARAAIEGGTGYYDNRDDEPSIDMQQSAFDMARALIARYFGPRVFSLAINELTGLEAGQLLPINRTDIPFNDSVLITSVQGTCTFADSKDFWTFNVSATEGTAAGGWQKFFAALVAATQSDAVTSTEVLGLLRTAAESLTLADAISTTTAARESRIDTGRIGYMEIG